MTRGFAFARRRRLRRGWQQQEHTTAPSNGHAQWPLTAETERSRSSTLRPRESRQFRGCCGGVSELPQAQPWVSGRVVASAASLVAGVAGGLRWRASLAGVAGGVAQKHREIQLRRLKHHTPPKRETRTAHFERRQHARDEQPSADQRHRRLPITARARAKTTKGVEPANRRMTRQRSRVNRHAQTQPQTDHQARKNRRERQFHPFGNNRKRKPTRRRRVG